MFFRRKSIPHARVDDADVVHFIRRFDGFGPEGRTLLVSPPSEAGENTAIQGPAGFSMHLLRLSPDGEHAEVGGDACYRALHVVRGAVETVPITNAGQERLAVRDAMLIPPHATKRLSAMNDEEAVVLMMSYRERDPSGRFVDGPSRRGLSRWQSITPVRKRFPVNLAPRFNAVLSPRDLYPMVGPVTRGPGAFDIHGPQGLVIAMAHTPRFTGPALHVHTMSSEMFVVLEGQFRIYWGEGGEYEAILKPLDVIVVPQGTNRAFEAYGSGENWLLPVVVGADDETEDIAWLPEVRRALLDVGPKWLAHLVTRVKLQIRSRE